MVLKVGSGGENRPADGRGEEAGTGRPDAPGEPDVVADSVASHVPHLEIDVIVDDNALPRVPQPTERDYDDVDEFAREVGITADYFKLTPPVYPLNGYKFHPGVVINTKNFLDLAEEYSYEIEGRRFIKITCPQGTFFFDTEPVDDILDDDYYSYYIKEK
ncbi:MAG: hypothetical protein ACTSUE_05940 [Promethearchaeota archaeon]